MEGRRTRHGVRVTGIDELIAEMDEREARLLAAADARRYFHSTYLRTTRAVAAAIGDGAFRDPAWVERWDVAFAGLYVAAFDQYERAGTAPGPWQTAFDEAASGTLPPLRHTLLGMNAHINFDLPQALIAVISPADFDDATVLADRAADHERIDGILAARVRPEDRELKQIEPPGSRTIVDRLLTPFNTAGTKRFLKESREKVWHNARVLDRARREGDDVLARAIEDLGTRSRTRVADLARPGQVILRLARDGFGIVLPDAARGTEPHR